MCKKKYFFAVLCTLLLTLLLGTYTSCYAISVSDATTVMKEMSTNGTAKTWNNYIKAINDWVTNYSDNQYSCLSTYFNSYDNFVCCSLNEYAANNMATKPLYYTLNMLFIFWNNADGLKYYVSNNKLYFNQSVTYLSVRLDSSSNGQPATIHNPQEYTNTYMSSMTNINRCVLYMSSPIYTNNNYTTTNDNINTSLNTGVTLDKWEFTPNGTIVTINGSQWGYRYLDASYNLHLGSLVDAQHLHTIKVRFASYNQSLGVFAPYSDSRWQIIYDYDRDGRLTTRYPGAITNNNGVLTLNWSMDLHNQQNNLMQLTFVSDNPNEWQTITQDYYLGNTFTYVSSGVVYPNLTFSGDYNNDYNNQQNNNQNQQNTDDTINAINDLQDDSEVDSIIGDFLNSGDLLDSIGGYNYFENPFIAFVEDLADNFVEVLTGSGNEHINIEWNGENFTFYSNNFVLPNGSVKNLISTICNALFVWGIIKYGYALYEWIRTGRIQNWLNNTSSGNIEDYFLF